MARHRHIEHVLHSEQALAEDQQHGLYGWDARVKLALIVLVIVLNTWLAIPWLSGVLLVVGIGVLCWTRPPWRQQMPFLLVPLVPTVLVLAGFAIGFGARPLGHLGPLTFYAEGLTRGGQVALRAYCDVTWLMSCVLTSPFSQIISALRWYRVPFILVDTLAMMYRYSFLLYTEFRRMRMAARSRGGFSGYKAEMSSISRIAALIFLRAFDRSERIYWAMVARGGEQHE